MANRPCKKCIHEEACKTANPDMVKKTFECEHFEDKEKIKSALEKQIPKKPLGIYGENIYHIDDDDYIYEPALFGSCPACDKEVQDGMLFCSFCGQALDWSDEE